MSHWVNEGWIEVNKTFLWKQNKHKNNQNVKNNEPTTKFQCHLHKGK